jgi:divalent metal cation (Fe/Co/Zn/Cd) transporter
MRALRLAGVIAAFALLLVGTTLVFSAFDRVSHSASDTLRPFVITMAPVWAVAMAAAWVLLRRPASAHDA